MPASTQAVRDVVPVGFFYRLISELTDAMGPMACVIVHDQIAALSESPENFPKARLEELIESISLDSWTKH